ncbi:MAG TPA: ATP-grasp domain-containing protein [Candidatus Acidoferrales bacterium]|nr:ATP-grasp domain-containing protein [Candidatus Acidoferrales bacterium]
MVAPQPTKRLLLLASKLGYQTRSFADAVRRAGAEPVFGTDRCHQLDDPWGDAALPLRFEDPPAAAEAIAEFAVRKPIAAVLALGDFPVLAAAWAARRLGLAGNAVEAAENCRTKLRQRQVLAAGGLPVPEFFAFRLDEPLVGVLERVRFPCVVKPLVLAASQGVIRADDPAQFRDAVARIRALVESPPVQAAHRDDLDSLLVESYIPGGEVALEGLLTAGKLRQLALFDKPDPLEGPFFEESIYVTPSRLPAGVQQAIGDCAEHAVRALGLSHGPLHAEFRIEGSQPWVLEIQPRPIGGLCARALRFGPEAIGLEELLARHALGLPGADGERESEASGVMMIPVPRSGIYEGVEGLEAARAAPGVTEIEITARPRDPVLAWPEGSSYLGFIFARAPLPEEAEQALRAAHARLAFRFASELPVEHPTAPTRAGHRAG